VSYPTACFVKVLERVLQSCEGSFVVTLCESCKCSVLKPHAPTIEILVQLAQVGVNVHEAFAA